MELGDILSSLNPAQAAAVTTDAEVVQILAPPGSGKTKTLTSRVAYHLNHHRYKPWNVLCVTFTIKSAREMKERVAKLVGDGLESKIVLGTFHSVCRRYLAKYGHLINMRKRWAIADSTDSLNIVKRIVKRLKITTQPNSLRSRISSCKARRIGCEQLRMQASQKKSKAGPEQEEFLRVFEDYEDHLSVSNLLDFDDLLLRCVDLLEQHPECVSNVEAVLIDEFQDTNCVQFDLMRLFASSKHRITIVGDPDQSIYGWRSAQIENLTKMRTLYPETLVLNLELNYRSTGAILAAALEVIEQDESRPPKPLLPTHGHGTFPVLRTLGSSHDQASWVVSEIRRYMALTGGDLINYSDFAILLRSAALSRLIESALGKSGIPYRMVGGARFFDRVEIKLLLNYLRVILSPNNSVAFSAIINVPARRIGELTIKSLLEEASTKGMDLFSLCQNITKSGTASTVKITTQAKRSLASLIDIILTARRRISEDPTFFPKEVLNFVIDQLAFKAYLSKAYPEDEDARWANVEELIAQTADPNFGNQTDEEDPDSLPQVEGVEQQPSASPTEEALTKFLANVALATELQTDDDTDENSNTPRHRVTISTIHAAKGLEWPVVFIPSVYQGSIPHSRSEDYDEERRLLYVAMTRAQSLLSVSYPLESSTFRESTTESQFLASKEVKRHFANQGPSFSSSTIHHIAQTLGRECPSEASIIAGLAAAENIEDDLWTEEGEECRYGDSERRSNAWSPRSYKRRKFEYGGSGPITQNTPIASTTQSVQSNDIQSSAQSSSGFVSANVHLSSVQQSEPTESELNVARKRPIAKIDPSQSTLTSHGIRTGSMIAKQGIEAIVANITRPVGSTRKESVDGSASLPDHPISRASLARPRVTMAENSTRSYAFLSSSPPPEPRQNEVIDDQGSHGPTVGPTIAASTFHRTSVQLLQETSNTGVRKSLGVRRSMVGWSNRGTRPFTMPRKV